MNVNFEHSDYSLNALRSALSANATTRLQQCRLQDFGFAASTTRCLQLCRSAHCERIGANHAIVGEARASVPRVARLYDLCCMTPVVLVNTARETFLHNNARLCIAAPVDKLQQAQARLYFVFLTAYGYPAGVMALIARLTRLSPSYVAVPPFDTSRSMMRARISAVIC